jgi:Cys-tRNA(Pro)/Cys-tRNA(Cys) deacylase
MKPTNVTRLLDQRNIPYTVEELPARKLSAVEVAQILGVSPNEVYKTIVVKRKAKGKPILAVIPGDKSVNLKLVAQAIGEKKVELATEREAELLTKHEAGGISPLALINERFQVILDRDVLLLEYLYISGGQRGINIRLPVTDLIEITNASLSSITI